MVSRRLRRRARCSRGLCGAGGGGRGKEEAGGEIAACDAAPATAAGTGTGAAANAATSTIASGPNGAYRCAKPETNGRAVSRSELLTVGEGHVQNDLLAARDSATAGAAKNIAADNGRCYCCCAARPSHNSTRECIAARRANAAGHTAGNPITVGTAGAHPTAASAAAAATRESVALGEAVDGAVAHTNVDHRILNGYSCDAEGGRRGRGRHRRWRERQSSDDG